MDTKNKTPLSKVEYLKDETVDSRLDHELRSILSICFIKPHHSVFQKRRYFREPPQHRWIIRNKSGEIVAHAAVHEKTVTAGGEKFKIGGVAEVCVHPEFRGHGLVKILLSSVNKWLCSQNFPFSVLFGNPRIYSSSGYSPVDNLFHDSETDNGTTMRKQSSHAMIKQLLDKSWPLEEVSLPGLSF